MAWADVDGDEDDLPPILDEEPDEPEVTLEEIHYERPWKVGHAPAPCRDARAIHPPIVLGHAPHTRSLPWDSRGAIGCCFRLCVWSWHCCGDQGLHVGVCSFPRCGAAT